MLASIRLLRRAAQESCPPVHWFAGWGVLLVHWCFSQLVNELTERMVKAAPVAIPDTAVSL